MPGNKGSDQNTGINSDRLATMLGRDARPPLYRRKPQTALQTAEDDELKHQKELNALEAKRKKISAARETAQKKLQEFEVKSSERILKIEELRRKEQLAFNKMSSKEREEISKQLKVEEKAHQNELRYRERYSRLQDRISRGEVRNATKTEHVKTNLERARVRKVALTKRAQAAQTLENVRGPVGAVARGWNAYNRVKAEGGVGAVATGLQAAGSGGGAIGNILTATGMGAKIGGPVGGGVAGVAVTAYESVKKLWDISTSASEDVLKFSGQYLKATTKIPGTTEDAKKSLISLSKEFAITFNDAIDANRSFGVSWEDTSKAMQEFIQVLRPTTASGRKAIGDLAKDTYELSTALNMSADSVKEMLAQNILAFGKQEPQARKNIMDVYDVVEKANVAFRKQLGDTQLRVDDMAMTIFDASRKAGLWDVNAEAMTKQLAKLAVAAREAGAAQQQLQKVTELGAQVMTDSSDAWVNQVAGAKEWESVQKRLANVKPEDRLSELTKLYGGNEQVAKGVLRTYERVQHEQKGAPGGMDYQLLAQQTMGTRSADQNRMKAFMQRVNKVSKGGSSQIALIAQLLGVDLKTAEQFLISAQGGVGFQAALGRAKGATGGAGIVQAAAGGINQATLNNVDAIKKMTEVNVMATSGAEALLKGFELATDGARSAGQALEELTDKIHSTISDLFEGKRKGETEEQYAARKTHAMKRVAKNVRQASPQGGLISSGAGLAETVLDRATNTPEVVIGDVENAAQRFQTPTALPSPPVGMPSPMPIAPIAPNAGSLSIQSAAVVQTTADKVKAVEIKTGKTPGQPIGSVTVERTTETYVVPLKDSRNTTKEAAKAAKQGAALGPEG